MDKFLWIDRVFVAVWLVIGLAKYGFGYATGDGIYWLALFWLMFHMLWVRSLQSELKRAEQKIRTLRMRTS